MTFLRMAKCSRLHCDNVQAYHTMFVRQDGYSRMCRSCFFGGSKVNDRNRSDDDKQMIEWFKQELKGIEV